MIRMLEGGFIFLVAGMFALAPAEAAQAHSKSNTRWNRYVEDFIEKDSQNWFMNRFDVGSVSRIGSMVSSDGQTMIVEAHYTFNGGVAGIIDIFLSNGKFECAEYWDREGQCRAFVPSEWLAAYDDGPREPAGNYNAGYPSRPSSQGIPDVVIFNHDHDMHSPGN